MTVELIAQIFELVIVPLLGILTTFVVKYINKKITEIDNSINNEKLSKYLSMLDNTIADCVSATTQTYVESLKAKGEFTVEAQKEAFSKTYNAVLSVINEDAFEYLQTALGDIKQYISLKVESEIQFQK